MIHELESRRHLSAVLKPNGVLIVSGTEASDVIELIRGGEQLDQVEVRLNAESLGLFPMLQIKRFSVGGLGGDDLIEIRQSIKRGGLRVRGLDTIPSWVEGGVGADSLVGGGASDTLIGGGGRDLLAGENGNDVLSGGAGNDKLQGDAGEDTLEGGAGNDRLHGGTEADNFLGGVGADTADYSDQILDLRISLDGFANDGVNYIEPRPDELGSCDNCDFAFEEKDNVLPDVENVFGGSGDDRLGGSPASNMLHGGDGMDVLHGGGGADSLYGGDGTFDEANFLDRMDDLGLSLDGIANDGAAGETGFLASDIEVIQAGAGNDFVVGNDLENLIYGSTGHDTILSAGGDDEVFAGGGLDYVEGGSGNDRLMGQSHSVQEFAWIPRQDDSLYGNDGDDWIFDAGRDVDVINGGRGDDTVGSNREDRLEAVETLLY